MNTTRIALTATASLLVLGLAGCSSTTPGEPEPTSAGESTSAASDPFHIDRPKNLKAISDPCQLLTPQQLQELGAATSGQHEQSQWGQPGCLWRNQNLSVNVAPDTVQRQGLRYTAKIVGDDNGNPTAAVDGYPALHYGATSGSCGTYVGTSDQELFFVSFQRGSEGRNNPEYADPCRVADRVAGMVISNLPDA